MSLVFHMFNMLITAFLTVLLHLIDTVLVVDETHIRRFMQDFSPESIVISDTYIFLMLMYFFGAVTIGGIAIMGTGTMILAYVKYICGMFRIAR